MPNTEKNIYSLDDHVSPVSGLGRDAVIARLDNSIDGRDSSDLPNFIREARKELEANPKFAIDYSSDLSISPWLRQSIMGESLPSSEVSKPSLLARAVLGLTGNSIKAKNNPSSEQLIQKLIEKKAGDEYVVDDNVFMNFLEWYNYNHVQRQHETKEIMLNNTLTLWEQLKRANKDGWIPRSVLKLNIYKLENLNTMIDDGYAFVNDNINNNSTSAQYNAVHNTIIFNANNPDLKGIDSIVSDSFSHEACHAMAGDRIDARYVYGGMNRIFGNKDGGMVIDEAITEHIAISLQQGSVDVISPVKKLGSYSEYRLLLETLCTKGLKKIDVREFIAAYFEDEDKAIRLGDSSAGHILVESLKESFPFDIISEIKKLDINDVPSFNRSISDMHLYDIEQ